MSTSYLFPAAPELLLILSGLVLLLVGSFKDHAAGARLVSTLALVTLAVAFFATIIVTPGAAIYAFREHFVLDAFAGFMKGVVFLGALGTLLIAQPYLRQEKLERFEYALLVLFSTAGMGLLLSANSFLALYVALELMTLPLYVMAAFKRDTFKSTEAGLKYFVLGALASGMLLYGISLVYGFTGTISFTALQDIYAAGDVRLPIGALVGLVFIAAGLAFKLGAVPFHMWTPDVYEGAPTAVTAFFAAAPKIAAMGLTVRVFAEPFGAFVADWQQIVIAVAVGSMALGAFGAIGQTNIKRLMAYSGIGHVGYALVGLAAGTERGVYGVLVYMTLYLFMTVGTFAVILTLRRRGQELERVQDFAGLSKEQPLLALAAAIFMFSLAGIPPLAGFFGKLYVFLAAVDAGLIALAVFGVLMSVVGAYYYLRIVKLMYFDAPPEPFDKTIEPELQAVLVVTTAVTALFIVFPGPILGTAQVAASALFP
ncbi:MAG: NADH-quinone oxidoreductase subunit NuoN [Geminicoccaceae bacterium]|nr:MAG: NADH-quinone oxidoreductase subunit NuoN [Geminicoccaceae bacterium]